MSDYWGPKEQKTAPKRVKVVPKPVASVRETQVKATIDRIFSSSGEERNAEVRRLASFCPPGFLWNPRDTDRLVAGFGKLIDGLGPNETEAVKGMAKRIFSTRSGVNGGTLNIISEMCDSKTIRDRMNAGQEVTAADVYYSLVDPKARWRTIGGVPLERIIRRPNVEGYAAPEAVAAPRMESEAPRVSKEKPAEAIVKIDGKEAASDLDKIMVDAIKNKNKLIDKVESKVNVAGVEASFDNLETAYANLKKYLETGEVNVETLGKLMYVFYGRLGEYSKSAANAYTAYKASQKRGLVESLTDIGAVPLITGVVGTIFLKKPPTTFGRMLARNAAVITGGGLVGGTVEWAGDNLIRSI
jgi:hypothetical protein